MSESIPTTQISLIPVADPTFAESIPKEAGLFLMLIGIGGILLPGPVGTPFLLLGGAVFFPKIFRKLDEGIQARFPESYRQGMKPVHRFVNDLERRYPRTS